MFKKLILTTAILAVTSTVALANDAPYVGGSLGVNADTFKFKDEANDTTDVGGRGAIANLFAGYGATVNQNIYLGGEVFADLTSSEADAKSGTDSSKDSMKEKYGYGISFIPGIMLSDHTLAYGRLGLVRSRFELSESNGTNSGTDKKTLTGGQIGVGLQTTLTQNVDLRGEYDFTSYKSGNFNTGIVGANKISPRSDSFNLGLVYKFD